ncbi:MAG: response regulator [Cellvibrionaceae bacterium]
MSHRKNRYNLLFRALIPPLSILIVLCSVLSLIHFQNLELQMNDRGRIAVSQLTLLLVSSENILDQEEREKYQQQLLSAALEDPSISSAVLYNQQGEITRQAGSAPHYQREIEKLRSLVRFSTGLTSFELDESTIFQHPLIPFAEFRRGIVSGKTQPFGWFEIEVSHAYYKLSFYKLLSLSLIIIFAGLIITWALAARDNLKLSDSIQSLSDIIHRIGRGDSTEAIKIEATELQAVADDLQRMSVHLLQAQHDMQQHIDQSMADLNQTLETIEVQNIELDLARKEAQQASQLKSEFLANTSHEIRTPLNGIIGFTNLLSRTTSDPQHKDYLRTIKRSAEGLHTIINDILDFSKIEAGKLVLDRLPFNLLYSIEETLQILAPSADTKGLELLLFVDSDVPRSLIGDPLRFRQILTNLINNAIKYSDNDNVIVRVYLENQQSNNIQLRVMVSDNGIGISEEQQKVLFTAFSQLDQAQNRTETGTGLGLAICKGLITQMNGDIGVESRPGKGSTFWFTLQLEKDLHETTTKIREPDFEGRRVLCCSNNEMAQMQIRHLFESWDILVSDTDNTAQLASLLTQSKGELYDIVVFDLSSQDRSIAPKNLLPLQELITHRGAKSIFLVPNRLYQEADSVLGSEECIVISKPLSEQKLYQGCFELLTGKALVVDKPTDIQKIQKKLGRPINALAVDDNPANLKLIGTLLREMGVNVSTAQSGEEAIDRWAQEHPDVIFMDVRMPGIDGMEASRLIRIREPAQQKTPIIAVTAHALAEQRSNMIAAGMNDYLTKPVSEADLVHVLNEWCLHKRIDDESQTTEKILAASIPPAIPTGEPIKPEPVEKASPPPTQELLVDIEESLTLAKGKSELATEMLNMLVNNLLKDKEDIDVHYKGEQWEELEDKVHKLHGATCYCGLPQLKQACQLYEGELQQGNYDHRLEPLHEKLMDVMDALLEWAEHHEISALFEDTST